LQWFKLILIYTYTSSKIPKESSEASLFDSSKTYTVLNYPMKEHVAKNFLIENNLWAGIPKSSFDLDLALFWLNLDWALFSNFMAFTKVFDHILSRGIGKGSGSTLIGTYSVSWER